MPAHSWTPHPASQLKKVGRLVALSPQEWRGVTGSQTAAIILHGNNDPPAKRWHDSCDSWSLHSAVWGNRSRINTFCQFPKILSVPLIEQRIISNFSVPYPGGQTLPNVLDTLLSLVIAQLLPSLSSRLHGWSVHTQACLHAEKGV